MTAASIDHDTTVRASWRGSYHTAVCSCGWQAPVSMSEHAARELAATHYLAAGGSADDDSAELAASMARHPAGQALADAVVVGCWRSDPPRAARRLLELPADRQRACMVALGYLGDGTGQ